MHLLVIYSLHTAQISTTPHVYRRVRDTVWVRPCLLLICSLLLLASAYLYTCWLLAYCTFVYVTMSVILSCRSVWICHDNLAISGTIQGDTAHLVTTAQTPEQKKFSCLPYYEQASSPIGHSGGLALLAQALQYAFRQQTGQFSHSSTA